MTWLDPKNAPRGLYPCFVKRLLDVVISGLFLILFCWLYAIIAIRVHFDLPGPVIFKQERAGRFDKSFLLYKFHNMSEATGENGELLPKEQRITKHGAFLRKTSLDELPQFVNIIKGDMSIIGPRPLHMEYISRYTERQHKRHLVRPGLYCPMSIDQHICETSWDEQFERDVAYVENVSFCLDCRLLLRMFKVVFEKDSGETRSKASREVFMGKDMNNESIVTKSLDEV